MVGAGNHAAFLRELSFRKFVGYYNFCHMILFLFYCTATFEGSLQDQAKLMNEMGKITDAVVIITNQICGMEEVGCLQTNLDPSSHASSSAKQLPEPFQ